MELKPVNINRKYKDSLFRLIFSDKSELLQLYNALNDSDYNNPEELVITTIENVVYMGIKNDLSFIISDEMHLYEHQSTINPNMPIRGLLYFAREYEFYIDCNQLDVFGSRQIILPTPQYIVFYNGDKDMPERFEYHLNDAFNRKDVKPSIECNATVININTGYNQNILDKCTKLREYASFVQIIRDHIAEGFQANEAITQSVDIAINRGLLVDILRKNRAEVIAVVLTEYDEQRHISNERMIAKEEGWAEGWTEGRAEGRAEETINQIILKSAKGLDIATIADHIEKDEAYINSILTIYNENPGISITDIYKAYQKAYNI